MNKTEVESQVRLAQIDPTSFEPLYRLYYGGLMRFVTAKTGDQYLAEELVSNTFYKALNKINSYKHSEKGFDSWLYTIAINEVRMYFRKRNKVSFGLDINDFTETLSIEPNQVTDDLANDLKSRIENLKKDELELLELRFTEELSFHSIGEILNITSDNAKTKTYRLLKKIKNLFLTEDYRR